VSFRTKIDLYQKKRPGRQTPPFVFAQGCAAMGKFSPGQQLPVDVPSRFWVSPDGCQGGVEVECQEGQQAIVSSSTSGHEGRGVCAVAPSV